MELVSKGAGEKGAVWVARRVPDDSACSHANQARIRTWPRDDPDNVMFANDTVSFAVRKGLYPKDADPLAFSFSDVFCPIDFTGARLAEARAYNMLKEISDEPDFAARCVQLARLCDPGSRPFNRQTASLSPPQQLQPFVRARVCVCICVCGQTDAKGASNEGDACFVC